MRPAISKRQHAIIAARKRKRVFLPKLSIQKFIDRKREDWRSYKDLTEHDLQRLMDKFCEVRPPIWTKLRIHQKACLLLGVLNPTFAFFNDTGTGKSLLAISLGRYYEKLGTVKRALILVPVRVNKAEWAREIEKHSNADYIVLEGSSKNKWQQLEENPNATFVVETYAGMTRMLCKLVAGKKDKNKLTLDPKLVKRFIAQFQMVVTDEGTILGRKDNLPRRIVRQLRKTCPVYFNMTGTPFGRDPTLVWSQMQLIDDGWTLGETLGLFRATFFESKENNWGATEYKFDKSKKELLNRFLAHASIRYKADESDLPAVVEIKKHITLDEDAEQMAAKALAALRASKGNFIETKNAFLRMRQISSGFIGYKDDESGERAEHQFAENPKLEMLLQIIEGLDPEDKVVVFHDFNYSSERIAEGLKKAGIGYLQMYGKTKHPEKVLQQFDDDPKKQVFILSNAMGIGLNLQIAKYMIYYEAPVPVITRKQTRRRVERQESKHKKVFLYDLIVRGTMDERILAMHAEGDDLFRAIIEGRVTL